MHDYSVLASAVGYLLIHQSSKESPLDVEAPLSGSEPLPTVELSVWKRRHRIMESELTVLFK